MNIPTYTDYPSMLLEEIRERFLKIRDCASRKSLKQSTASNLEQQVDSPFFRGDSSMYAVSIRKCESDVQKIQVEINEHVQWLQKNAPEVMEGIRAVSPHITTWSEDYSMISLQHVHNPANRSRVEVSPEEKEAMQEWYIHFLGDEHCKG